MECKFQNDEIRYIYFMVTAISHLLVKYTNVYFQKAIVFHCNIVWNEIS